MVAYTCDPSYSEGRGRRIVAQASHGKNVRLYVKNNLSKKGMGSGLRDRTPP
jgi:hypothetical protein